MDQVTPHRYGGRKRLVIKGPDVWASRYRIVLLCFTSEARPRAASAALSRGSLPSDPASGCGNGAAENCFPSAAASASALDDFQGAALVALERGREVASAALSHGSLPSDPSASHACIAVLPNGTPGFRLQPK